MQHILDNGNMTPSNQLLAGGLLVLAVCWFVIWEVVQWRLNPPLQDHLLWWTSKGGTLLLAVAAWCVMLCGKQ